MPLRIRGRTFAAWSLALLLSLSGADATAQFNARGRGPRSKPKTTGQVRPTQKPKSVAPSPEKRQQTLIERYEKLIFSQPGEDVPLTRLAELVRKRDGNLNRLLKQLEEAAETSRDKYGALIAWGGILSKDDQSAAAIAKLESAAQLKPKRPEAWLLLGELHRSSGDTKAARASFEKAVPYVRGPERSLLVRSLRDLSLELTDYESAARHHQTLVREAKGNLFLQGELGRELLRRGQTARAVKELKRVVDEARGDSRALAPALRDLGTAQLEAKQIKDAISSLKRASRLAVASPGLRAAIDTLRADAHRKDGSLDQFLTELETTAASAPRLGLLGRLHEESGATERAVASYRKALRLAPRDIDLRLRLVRLYEVTGNIEGAVTEYGKLVKSSPRDVQLSLRYAEMLLAQGERKRAIKELDRIDRLTAKDPEAGLLLLDFADRLGEKERSRKILARLSRSTSRDARFLVELGARYYQDGQTDIARRTWKRILDVNPDRAAAHLMHGEVLIDHEAATEGVQQLRKAAELDPTNARVSKALALGLERAASQASGSTKTKYERDALEAWQGLLTTLSTSSDPGAEQSRGLARRHIVRIWKRSGRLTTAVGPLAAKLNGSPADLGAGRLLAEAYVASRSDQRAVEVLNKVLRHAPGDRSSLLALEAAHTRRGDYTQAIKTLEKLVEADPRRSREYYERMARTAALQNDQKGALKFAELAVQKSPTDPAALASLGDLYLAQSQLKDAESAYRKALAQDDRLHAVNLKLADILAKTERADQALDVLSHVLRSARNAETIGVAARRATTLSLALKAETQVEDVLRPLAISHPEQPLYRTLLLEVLSAQMYPLLLSVEHGPAKEQARARQKLAALADRSTGPLLSALSGENAGDQQTAIQLLAYSDAISAGSGLLAFAEGSGKEKQRLLAVLALGRFKNAKLVPRLAEMVITNGEPRRGRVARAALWALAQHGAPEETLLVCLGKGDPQLRALAALAIGDRSVNTRQRGKAQDALLEAIEGEQNGATVRAAAALALGRGGEPTEKLLDALSHASEARSALVSGSALSALIALSSDAPARQHLARGLLSQDAQLRAVANLVAPRLLTPERNPGRLLPERMSAEQLEALNLVKEAATNTRRTDNNEQRHRALVALTDALIEQAQVNLRASSAQATATLGQLEANTRGTLFGELLTRDDLLSSGSPHLQDALNAAERIRAALSKDITALAGGPQPGLAAQALRVLRPSDGTSAERVFARQLRSPSAQLHQAALSAIAANPSREAIDLLTPYLQEESSWGRRRRTASALGLMLRHAQEKALKSDITDLLKALKADPSKLVQSEAAEQLGTD